MKSGKDLVSAFLWLRLRHPMSTPSGEARSPLAGGHSPLNHFDRRALPLIIPIRLFNRIKGGCFSL